MSTHRPFRRSLILTAAASATALILACTDAPLSPARGPGGPPPTVPHASLTPPTLTSITDLGTLGGTNSFAYGVNDAGQVAGYSLNAAGSPRATRYSPGDGLVDLGTLPGDRSSTGYGINASGQVVGASLSAGSLNRAFRWTEGTGMVNLGTLGGAYSYAYGINDAGQVVGNSVTGGGQMHAYRWTEGTGMLDLGALPGDVTSFAYGINSAGQVAGYSESAVGVQRAFLWTEGSGMLDLGFLTGGAFSAAYGVNDAGQVVGHAGVTGNQTHAFRWSMATGMEDLGTLGGVFSYAYGINEFGQVSGHSRDASGEQRAFLWTPGVGMLDLGTLPGATLSFAFLQGINHRHQVVGTSNVGPGGVSHAVIWTLGGFNHDPVAALAASYTGTEGSPLSVVGTASTDPDGDALTYNWTFGDGAIGTGASASHAYVDNGAYIVTLKVTDPSGDFAQTTAPVTIENMPPVADAGPDQSRVLGRSTAIMPSFTDPGTSDGPWTYRVAWGDGTQSLLKTANAQGAQSALMRSFAAVGTYTATLTVTDKDGGSATDQTIITVVPNIVPVAVANGPYGGNEGTPVCFSSTGSSDANGDVITFAWAFGDGGKSTMANPCYSYKDNGPYTVSLTVKDPSGATNTESTTAAIANVAPTASFMAPTTITEGVVQTLTLSNGKDKSSADTATLEYAFNCGQGAGFRAYSKTVKTLTCRAFPDQHAAVTLTGRIRDKDGGVSTYTKILTITNAAPVVAFGATSVTTFAKGGTLNVQGSFTDKGLNDSPWSLKYAWGDGTPATLSSSTTQGVLPGESHVYNKTGTFKAKLTVTDKDGKATASSQITVVVTP